MQLTNKKLIKSYKAILTSSINAKAILESEAQKVDEKYKALAEQEKKDISEQLKALKTQIDICTGLIGDSDSSEDVINTKEDITESTDTVEEKVVDTLFAEETCETLPEDESEATSFAIDDAGTDVDEEPGEWIEQKEDKKSDKQSVKSEDTSSDDGWPAIPEEW